MPLKIFFAVSLKIVFVQTKTLSAEMTISQEPIKVGSGVEKNASWQKFLFRFIQLLNQNLDFFVFVVFVVFVAAAVVVAV